MNSTSFEADVKKGKVGEQIFIEDFLNFLQIKYQDVTGSQAFQIIDADFLSKIGLYEIKTNYRDNEQLIFEDYANIDPQYGRISEGWIKKSRADLIVFISKTSRSMIMLPFTEKFKIHYATSIANATPLNRNRPSEWNGRKWQSAFRVVPFSMLKGYISEYRRLT
jgi:hypothetical protein